MVSPFLGFCLIFLRSIHSGQKDFEVSSNPSDYSSCNHWNVESSDSKKTTPAGRICVDFWEMKVNSVTAVFAAQPVRSVQSTHHYTQTVVLHGSAKPRDTDILLQNIIKKGQNEPNEGKMLHNKRAKTDSICTT